ncbi:MAG: endonuclease Q family protein [Thermodesulfobacteriota bacterium]
MRIIADLHIHSGYSRATSREMNIPTIGLWARRKGIDLVGTGDFTHPAHFASIEEKLVPAEDGLFVPACDRDPASATRFMLTSEVSNIYKQGERTRKIHTLIFTPTIEAARRINSTLDRLGNIHSDGRPIFGFPVTDLVKVVLDADPDSMIVPAHAWTPWFSIFGSKSGFDSIEECFGDHAVHIHAIETGLSSNPQMNWRIEALDGVTLLSNSDAHSPAKLGREANVFDCAMSYYEIMDVIKTRDAGRFLHTVEFYPEEGKYHADGHRNCGVVFTPGQTREAGGVCPVCGGGLTVGVLSRVEELASRPHGFVPEGAVPARHLVPLVEILAEVMGVGAGSVKVAREYNRLVNEAASEFAILLDLTEGELDAIGGERLAEAVMKVRGGLLSISPGFDGEFGKIKIFGPTEEVTPRGPVQAALF